MSQSARHARIGFFVLLGAFLIFATAIYVGSVRLFANEVEVLFFFDESVNGLTKGSPVKFKGVTIGTVTDILITYDQAEDLEKSYIPVFAKIDMTRVHRDLGVDQSVDFHDTKTFDAQIVQGLRAKLEMISFITGQLYVELDYFAPQGADDIRIVQRELTYLEVPTVPSTMAEFGSSASSIMGKLASLDIKGLNDSLRQALGTLNARLEAMETEKWNTAVLKVADDLETLIAQVDLDGLLTEVRATNASLQALVAKVDGAVDPALASYHDLVGDARHTLGGIEEAFARLESLLGNNADVGADIDSTLLEVREAARAMRELLEFLERNPRSLLTGRPQP